MTFFRRRPGEVAQATLEDYETALQANYGKNATKDLSAYEKHMLPQNMLMKIIGKNSNPVSVLIRNDVKESLDVMITKRHLANLDPTNNYLFGADNSKGYVDPYPLYQRYSKCYELSQPLNMRATKLRHHLATSCHAFSTDEHDLERFAEFM